MNQKSSDPRDGLMAALSAVEQVVAALPVAPPVVTLNQFESGYSIDLYFRFGPEGVAAFAEAFCVEVNDNDTTSGAPHAAANVVACGHEVHAWWLGEVPAEAGLPVAWRAVGAA